MPERISILGLWIVLADGATSSAAERGDGRSCCLQDFPGYRCRHLHSTLAVFTIEPGLTSTSSRETDPFRRR
jgi:hypothetical protein